MSQMIRKTWSMLIVYDKSFFFVCQNDDLSYITEIDQSDQTLMYINPCGRSVALI